MATLVDLQTLAAAEAALSEERQLKQILTTGFYASLDALRHAPIEMFKETVADFRRYNEDVMRILAQVGSGMSAVLNIDVAVATLANADAPADQTLAQAVALGAAANLNIPREKQSALLAFLKRSLDPTGRCNTLHRCNWCVGWTHRFVAQALYHVPHP